MDHREFVWGTLEDGWRKGPWTPQEDRILIEHVNQHGEGRWNSVSRLTGLKRNGKSCRLRWVNYLRPDLKRGKITPHEEAIILDLHALWGNRWSTIARSLPGRTDNEIKNYWRTHFKKAERTRPRFLKQQEQQTQPQQEEVDQKHAQDDMMTTQAEVEAEALAQDMQEMPYMYPTSFMFQGGVSTRDDGSGEDCTWGSLWNLDGGGGGTAGLMQQDQVLSFC